MYNYIYNYIMAQYASNNVQYRRAPSKNHAQLVTNQAPPGIFQRNMEWRNKRDKKIKRMRQQAQLEGGTTSLNFNDQYKDATVGEHLDAYHRYNMIVGEADGGNPLPEAQYRKLEKRCLEAAKDRLFCTWRNMKTGMDCVNVGPMTRCFCGHSYRAHAFYRNQSKKVHCRVPGCKCTCFNYVYHRGGRAVKCQCKHDLEEHRDKNGRPIPCTHGDGRCMCNGFVPTVTCTCEQPATVHRTIFERRSERETSGRVTRALWEEMEKTGGGGGELMIKDGQQPQQEEIIGAGRNLANANMAMAAGAGGLTSYLSLAPGTERVLVQPTSALPLSKLNNGEYYNTTNNNMNDDDNSGIVTTMSWGDGGNNNNNINNNNNNSDFVNNGVQNLNLNFQLPLENMQQKEQQQEQHHQQPLSPLSKHIAQHEQELKLLKKKQKKQSSYGGNNNNNSYRNNYAQRKNLQNNSRSNNNNNVGGTSYLKRGSRAKASPRLARKQQQNRNTTRKNNNKNIGSRIVNSSNKKSLPSYMRSTAATRLWKSSTEDEKKKPKHMRTEIY